jgi:hypothetical protein
MAMREEILRKKVKDIFNRCTFIRQECIDEATEKMTQWILTNRREMNMDEFSELIRSYQREN